VNSELWRKQFWFVLTYCPCICLKRLRKTTKNVWDWELKERPINGNIYLYDVMFCALVMGIMEVTKDGIVSLNNK
jgi:hypothetical protein